MRAPWVGALVFTHLYYSVPVQVLRFLHRNWKSSVGFVTCGSDPGARPAHRLGSLPPTEPATSSRSSQNWSRRCYRSERPGPRRLIPSPLPRRQVHRFPSDKHLGRAPDNVKH